MGATGNTIPAEPRLPAGAASAATGKATARRSGLKTLLQGLFILAASAFLAWLAWPRLHASLLYLPVDTAIGNYYRDGRIDGRQLEALRARAREAIAVHPHHRYWEGLSLLHFVAAADPRKRLYERRDAFEASIRAGEASLGLAPAQPRAWLRVARARAWLRYQPEQVIEALKMAIYTGRVEPALVHARLELGFAYLPRMDAEARAMLRDQLLLAWRMRPRDLVRELRTGSLKFQPVEALLEGAHDPVLDEIREAVDGPAR